MEDIELRMDSVVCRVIGADGFLNVTHTVKDHSGRRISDVQSVTDLLEALPSLVEPILEAIPYDFNYYDQWARVSRDISSRNSLRPITVTVKSWTLLHSVPTSPQHCNDVPSSPRRRRASSSYSNASISSSKSLDSILEEYNKLYPPESDCEKKVKVNGANDSYISTDNQPKITEKKGYKESPYRRRFSATEKPLDISLSSSSENNKLEAGESSKLPLLTNSGRFSCVPEQNYKVENYSRKNKLQVPLHTGLASIQCPFTFPQQDDHHKSTQFLTWCQRKLSGRVSPRVKTPEPFTDQQDTDLQESQGQATLTNLTGVQEFQDKAGLIKPRDLKVTQFSESSLALAQDGFGGRVELKSSRCPCRECGNILRSPSPLPRRYSAPSNAVIASNGLQGCNFAFVDTGNRPSGIDVPMSRRESTYENLALTSRQSTVNLTSAAATLDFLKIPQMKLNNDNYLQVRSSISRSKSPDVSMATAGSRSPRRRHSKSMKLDQDTTAFVLEGRQKSSRSRHSKHRRSVSPMVQYLGINDLKVIYDKADRAQKEP